MTTLLQDLRFVVRQIRRAPAFAVTAVLILALAIAANLIVFGVLQALVLRPLDVPNPERVMTLTHPDSGVPIYSYPEVRDLRDNNKVFSAVAAFGITPIGLESHGSARPVLGYLVTGQYFEVVNIKPYLGRLLQPADDDHPGASDAAVLSWPAWKSYFDADPNIVGKSIRISKHPYTVVGVTPEGFYGTERYLQPAVFVPLANEASLTGVDYLQLRIGGSLQPIVRIKEGVTRSQAQANLDSIAAQITRQYPKEEEHLAFKLAHPGLLGDMGGKLVRGFLAGILGLAAIVLLAACANIGSLFAARTSDRAREIAIRMAVGSSRGRIVRHVLLEAFVISTLGGACACALAWMALTSLAAWQPPTSKTLKLFVLPHPSLILIGLLISVVAGVLFGAMPLRQIFRTDPNHAMKSGGNQSLSSTGRRWQLRDVLLAAQIALCFVTVTAAFVSLRSLGKTLTVNIGINPKNAVLTTFDLSSAGYSNADSDQFQRQLLKNVSQVPGVEAAGYTNIAPLSGTAPGNAVFSEEATDFRLSNGAFQTYFYDISPGFLNAAGTPLLEGRDVSYADTANTPRVAIVNQEFARRLFHTEHAVGRYFKHLDVSSQAGLGQAASGQAVSVQIVGIVADGKYFLLAEEPQAAEFLPISQGSILKVTSLVVRSQRDSADMAGTVRQAVRDLDPAVPIMDSSAWSSKLAIQLLPAQTATFALGLIGVFGLLLSITGTFGLASYTVSKRMRELSIRIALGAQARQVVSAALGRMLIILATGSAVGLLLGVAASRVLSAIVYQATAKDPVVLAAVVITMLITASFAIAGPVHRALHADPAELLRQE